MSIRLFRDSMVVRQDGSIDASGVISKRCYDEWLKARCAPETPGDAKRYQRVLSNHLSGVDGRCPFREDEEEAILKVVRRKERWPCFPAHISIGHTGFRSKGYHEKQRDRARQSGGGGGGGASAASARGSSRQDHQEDGHDDDDRDAPEDDDDDVAAASPTSKPLLASSAASIVPFHHQHHQHQQHHQHAYYQQQPHFSQPAPPPPPPLQDGSSFDALGENLQLYVSAFDAIGVDVWESVVGIFKFTVLPRLPLLPPRNNSMAGGKHQEEDLFHREYALDLCGRHSGGTAAAAEDAAAPLVLVWNLSQPFHARIAAQNAACSKVIGNLVGNCTNRFIMTSSLANAVAVFGRAFQNMGVQFATHMTLQPVGAAAEPVEWTPCVYADPHTGLVVAYGKL